VAYRDLDSANALTGNTQDDADHRPYANMAADADWSRYTAATLEPVVIYQGPDAQFDDADASDRQALAGYMQSVFGEALRERFKTPVSTPAQTLRVRVTLTGLETNTPVLSTVTKVLPIGLVRNTANSVSGGQSHNGGSVSYAVEIYDAGTQELLRAYVSKRYPMAMDIGASMGTLAAAQAGAREGAEDLVSQLQ